jgi:hypothetical protein
MYKNIAFALQLSLLAAFAQTEGPGRALAFDGTTADYIIVNPIDNFVGSAITIEFWMRTTDTTKAGTPISYAVTGQDNMLFIHDYRDFRFRLNGQAIPASGGTGVSANDGQWHHIALMWRNNGTFILYKDGVQQYSATGIQSGFLIPDPGVLVIGQEQDSVGGGFQSSEAFLGSIDEVRIWNIQRTETEIRANMHRSLAGNESGLQVYYRMDEASGSSMIDSGGDNRTGTLFGATRQTSTVLLGLPVTVTTLAPSGISMTSATLNGTVDPNGLASFGFFEYGTNGNFAFETPRLSINGTAGPTPITRTVTLRASTTYEFRAVGSNVLGKVVGSAYTINTPGPPSATTQPATLVTGDGAMLWATINPRGSATSAYFEYGTTTNYGLRTPSISVGNGFSDNTMVRSVSGLAFNTIYHFRAVASNSVGVTYGPDVTFITQTFGEARDLGYAFTDAAWADYNNDGYLELILTAFDGDLPFTSAYQNYGSFFNPVNVTLPNVAGGLTRWGDFDNDGLLDVFIMGLTGGNNRISQIRRNEGNSFSFSDIGAGLPGLSHGAAAWGDYDRDGDLDLVISGTTNGVDGGRFSQVLRNNGDGTFRTGPAIPALWRSAVAWGDMDNDGDLDLALAGLQVGLFGRTYRNDGSGFTSFQSIPAVVDGSLAWGDYDNDGDPDLLISGTTSSTPIGGICQIWRNAGNGSLTQIAALPGISTGSAAWGDYDNDGDLDVALTGVHTNGVGLSQIYGNNGDGTFSLLSTSMPGLTRGAVAWADYDNDGDLDLALVGTNLSGGIGHLRRNDSFPANDVPEAPSGLTATIGSSSFSFRWHRASDAQTPSNALTYNVEISGGVMGAQADLATGYRRLPAVGNTEQGTNFLLLIPTNFPGGIYNWGVQAVDSAFAGGPFARGTFEYAGDPTIASTTVSDVGTDRATFEALVNPGGRNTSVAFDFGTSTNYGTQLGATNIGNGFSNVSATFDVTDLVPDTTYHFRATAFNVLGAFNGPDITFRTGFLSANPNIVPVSLPPGAATNVIITLSNHIASAVSVTNRFRAPAPVWAAIINPTISLAAYGTANVNVLIDATGRNPGLYQATIQVLTSGAHATVQIPVYLTVIAAQPADITSVSVQANGSMLLDFAGTSGYTQTVFASTNLEDWIAIGPAAQISPGHFQFTDPAATNFTQRFYKVRTP